jgi:hypothetical protein
MERVAGAGAGEVQRRLGGASGPARSNVTAPVMVRPPGRHSAFIHQITLPGLSVESGCARYRTYKVNLFVQLLAPWRVFALPEYPVLSPSTRLGSSHQGDLLMATDIRPARRRARQQPEQKNQLPPGGAGEATPKNGAAQIAQFTVIKGEGPMVAPDKGLRRARTLRDPDVDRTLCGLAVFGGCGLFWLAILELCKRLF